MSTFGPDVCITQHLGIGPPDSSQLRELGAPQKLAQPASLVHLFPGIPSSFLYINHPSPARSSCCQQDLCFGCHRAPGFSPLLSCGLPQSRVRPDPPTRHSRDASNTDAAEGKMQPSCLHPQGAFHHDSRATIPVWGHQSPSPILEAVTQK